jgi:hypothetical protein
LDETAKEEFFDQPGFDEKPNETKRQTHKELKGRKMFASKRGAATADEVLETKESSAYHQYNGQMTTTQRAQTFALNPEIANSITEAESKNRERNNNEDNKLLRQADENLICAESTHEWGRCWSIHCGPPIR